MSCLVICANCGWSCRCSSDGLALEEAEMHEGHDPAALIEFHHEAAS